MAHLIVVDEATTIREQTNRCLFPLGISEREWDWWAFFNFWKYGSGWIGQANLIGCKCSATLTVKLNYAPNKNFNFLSATYIYNYLLSVIRHKAPIVEHQVKIKLPTDFDKQPILFVGHCSFLIRLSYDNISFEIILSLVFFLRHYY